MPRPLQNRVDPFGQLQAVRARGAWMGNRGVLHDEAKKIVTPGRYSELFFLDEATAYAAGHRPCAECRRQDFNAFRAAWGGGSADEIDAVLHEERAIKGGGKRTYEAALRELPPGAFFEHEGRAYLVSESGPLRWSFEGYSPPVRMGNGKVRVLTPGTIVRMFRAGFTPEVHRSGASRRAR